MPVKITPDARVARSAPLPLFAWAARQQRRTVGGPRLVLRDDLRDPDGEPRACILIPGRRVPLAFPNISAAVAALRRMEGTAQ
ncbi:MAG TPA: hypothetical protein VJ779_09630 [Acetobacteraceae bacterium]|nr:hypothetical protein [Acetobacteraceae bacterium]